MDTALDSRIGKPWPLGAHWDGRGINFAIFSASADAIEVCIFDATMTKQTASLFLANRTSDVWHAYLPDAAPGTIYALRAYGSSNPDLGHRFDSSKLLLDPYAREILRSNDGSFIARVEQPDQKRFPLSPLAGVQTNKHRVIYELHVKGFSKLNPVIPSSLRGTFAGLAHSASIAHLKSLGVTAVSLLPVHFSLDEERLTAMGLSNYWGYNTLGFFCPNPKLSSIPNAKQEFRAMVQSLHAASIEVLLDVVYNHSAESDEVGPTISFRGLDNQHYYRLPPLALDRYENYSGCGNTLDVRQRPVLKLVMDSLRYWVSDMGVDGFRFDLGPVLGRDGLDTESNGFNARAPFFEAVAQDPVLSQVVMIAEPWDIGPGGYQLGNFPKGWHEWNDHYRDTMRRYWLHHGTPNASRAEFAMRLCGSSDIFQHRGRSPGESINYVVSHDGFTLRDLVSYENRHNLANGENNRDGHGNNLSINCGAEGSTDNAEINAVRGKLQRALIATALLSQGTPMLCAGDEIGHTQNGNNNPYCQDNATTWIDWSAGDASLAQFTAYTIGLRRTYLPLGMHWLSGEKDLNGNVDIVWRKSCGTGFDSDDWHSQSQHGIACLIHVVNLADAMMLIANPTHASQSFTLPNGQWQVLLDSSAKNTNYESTPLATGQFVAQASSLVLLKQIA
jgi:glycogen debranching enzyme GlgX